MNFIYGQLTFAGIKFAGMYSPMHSSNKVDFFVLHILLNFVPSLGFNLPPLLQMKALAMFQNDASCMALLMDGSAALGLDLSFVTHVFLMEPIWDKR